MLRWWMIIEARRMQEVEKPILAIENVDDDAMDELKYHESQLGEEPTLGVEADTMETVNNGKDREIDVRNVDDDPVDIVKDDQTQEVVVEPTLDTVEVDKPQEVEEPPLEVEKIRKQEKRKKSKSRAMTEDNSNENSGLAITGLAAVAAGTAAASIFASQDTAEPTLHDDMDTSLDIQASESAKPRASTEVDNRVPHKAELSTHETSSLRSLSPAADAPRAEDVGLAVDHHVEKQVSAQDLLAPSWSFRDNRDSAIVVDDAESPRQTYVRDTTRDSGFPETPIIPHDGMQVQVEVPQDWDVDVSHGSPPKPVFEDMAIVEAEESIGELTPLHQLRHMESPAVVESTSRDRANALLFESSPSTREHSQLEDIRPVSSIVEVEYSQVRHQQASTPRIPDESPFGGLSARMEVDADSPLAKKTHKLRDMADTERKTKSAKLSTSSRDPKESRRVVSGPAQGLQIKPPSSRPGAISPESHMSIDDILAQRSWPAVDDDKETVGMDTMTTVARERRASPTPRSRQSSSPRHDLRRMTPMGDVRSPTGESGGISSPDLKGSLSIGSLKSPRTSSHALRRIDSRSRSGDLRSASRMSERGGETVSPTSGPSRPSSGFGQVVAAGAVAAGVGFAAASIAGRSAHRDKGKARALDMEGIYVSSNPVLSDWVCRVCGADCLFTGRSW
jgi:hypothetical protein